MWKRLKKGFASRLSWTFFIVYTLWWLYFHLPGVGNNSQYNYFTVTYGVLAAWGSFWGFVIAKKWGALKSVTGKALIMFSLGLALQEFGQLVYTYYIYYQHIKVPYPSLGDIGYFGSIPCYTYGVILLAKAAGIRVSLRAFTGKLQAIIVPAIVLFFSYFVFLNGYQFNWSQPLTIFLDFGYPLGDAIYISFAIVTLLLSRKLLGGVMKNKILLILIALVAQYISDWTFLYQSSRGNWSISGINDYMYLVAYFLMTLGLLQIGTVLSKLRNK